MSLKIPMGVGKYQVCAVTGCNADAVSEFYALKPAGKVLCLGTCPAHLATVRNLAAAIAGVPGGPPAEVDVEHIFMAEPASGEKQRIEPPKRRSQQTGQTGQTKMIDVRTTTALNGWYYVEEPGYFMDVKCEIKRLEDFERDELLSVARALVVNTYQRVSKHVQWILGDDYTPTVLYAYPAKLLAAAGRKPATKKLEEIRAILV